MPFQHETQGELDRITRLEMWREEATRQFAHIHECMHDVKRVVGKSEQRWSRLWVLLAFLAGLVFSSGSGTVSLQTILKALAH